MNAILQRLLAVFVALTAVAAAANHEFLSMTTPPGATLKALCPFSQPPAFGLLPVVFELTNPTTKPVTWEVNQANRGYYSGSFSRSLSLSCPAGESRTSTVLFAVGEMVWNGGGYYGGVGQLPLSVTADGTTNSGTLGDYGNHGSSVLGGSKLRASTKVPLENIEFETALAPTDWRAYQGYSGVAIADSEWRAMPPGAKLALTTWVKTGGVLAIVALDPASTAATLGLPAVDQGSETACGLGHHKVVESQMRDLSLFLTSKSKGADGQSSYSDSRMGSWKEHAPGLFAGQGKSSLNLLLLAVVLVFAILIGPVNLWLIAPAARRHRLFFSVPIISLATVLLLLAAVLLGDGMGGKGTRFVLIENRPGEGENTNHIVQYQTSRCGVMFSTGFKAPGSAFVEGLASLNSSGRNNAEYELVAEADGLRGSGPFFSSRTSQHFRVAGVVPTRGRIELGECDGATAKLTSTFDFPLEKLYFTRDGKAWFVAEGVKPGEPATAKPLTASVEMEMQAALNEAPEEISDRVGQLRQRPMHFVAFTAKPAAIATHGSIRWTDHGIVTGALVVP